MCSYISGFHAVILMCTLLWFKVFWCSLVNCWCVWTVKYYLEALYQNVYSNESTLLRLDGGLSLCCCVNPLHFSLWHLYSTRGSFPSVFRGINKGCAKTSCLYSSTRVSTSPEVLIRCSWHDTGVCHGHPPLEYHSPYAKSPNPLHMGPVYEWTPMNICCDPWD